MKEPLSILEHHEIQDDTVKDNFRKLSQLFNGELVVKKGVISTAWLDVSSAAAEVDVAFSRIGDQITIQFLNEVASSGNKPNTTDPTLVGALPDYLRPKAYVAFTVPTVIGVLDTSTKLAIDINGTVTLLRYATSTWSAATTMTTRATAVSYIGN